MNRILTNLLIMPPEQRSAVMINHRPWLIDKTFLQALYKIKAQLCILSRIIRAVEAPNSIEVALPYKEINRWPVVDITSPPPGSVADESAPGAK
jgi:hypothetical protein